MLKISVNSYPTTIFVLKILSAFYICCIIQMHFRLDFVMEANNMSLDWSSLNWVHIVLQHRVPKNKRADNKIHDWREKGKLKTRLDTSCD